MQDVPLENHGHDITKQEEGSLASDDGDKNEAASNLSGSFQDDDASTVDLAEEREKKVRRSLLFAILSVCGLLFCMQMMGRVLEKFSKSSSEVDGNDVVEMAADEVAAAAREGAIGNAAAAAGGANNPAL